MMMIVAVLTTIIMPFVGGYISSFGRPADPMWAKPWFGVKE